MFDRVCLIAVARDEYQRHTPMDRSASEPRDDPVGHHTEETLNSARKPAC